MAPMNTLLCMATIINIYDFTYYVRTIYEGNIAETDRRIIVAKSYAEATGFIVAHKAGFSI